VIFSCLRELADRLQIPHIDSAGDDMLVVEDEKVDRASDSGSDIGNSHAISSDTRGSDENESNNYVLKFDQAFDQHAPLLPQVTRAAPVVSSARAKQFARQFEQQDPPPPRLVISDEIFVESSEGRKVVGESIELMNIHKESLPQVVLDVVTDEVEQQPSSRVEYTEQDVERVRHIIKDVVLLGSTVSQKVCCIIN